MKKTLSLIVSFLLCSGYASTAGENPWVAYRYAPDALQEMDLASDTDWTLSVDDGAPRSIKVTAGGWNSDQQDPQISSAAVKDCAVYERAITIPAEAKGQVVKILFGGCNHGAEVYLDDQKITEHHAPMTPFEADVTAVAKPGQTQRLKVKAYIKHHYGRPPTVPCGFDYNKGMTFYTDAIGSALQGTTKHAYGLIGHVRLALYPAVHLAEVFVRPSVSGKVLAYDVWIANGSANEREVVLKGTLSPWNNGAWSYPALPDRTVRLAPGQVQKVTIEGVPWNLGPLSYWWPNIPFREDYTATLHWLNLALEEAGKPLHKLRQRFGFAEHKEGPFYYTVNGVRYTSFADSNAHGQVGEFDCWSETPCFQPPRGEVKGCPETWKRYQRIGFNSMRVHQSVPTRYMLETADEAGFMLVPEGAGRGDDKVDKVHKKNFSFQVQEIIRFSRNHPSVARYSLSNETLPHHFDSPQNEWRWLIDAAVEVDPTRPLVFEVCNFRSGLVPGMEKGHAYQMEHYVPINKGGDYIRGLGECAWITDGMAAFCSFVLPMRVNDWTHIAPWSWVNYWPNFLEGMNAKRHPWKANDYGDRRDGVDGWGSPIVQAVQWVLDPYLVVDMGLLKLNPTIKEGSKADKIGWPYRMPIYAAGTKIERKIEMFNGGLVGNRLELRWTAHWDSPSGPLAGKGAVGPIQIEPGFHATQTVAFDAPQPEAEERTLYLVLESLKDGKVVYRDERSRLTVTTRAIPASEATFVGEDEKTQGNWLEKYGKEGYWGVAIGDKKPAYAWMDHNASRTWMKDTTDPRALLTKDGKRNPNFWCWDRVALLDMTFLFDVGPAPREVSFYFVDWDDEGRREQTVSVWSWDGQLLDQRTVSGFQQSKYLTWKMQGRIKVEVKQKAGKQAVVNGIFMD